MKLTLSLIILLTAGCAGPVRKLGSVGLRDYYSVREHSIAGPNITKLVSINRFKPEEVRDEASAHGPSIGHAVIGIGSGAVQGVAGQAVRRPSTTKVTQDNSTTENINAW